MKGLRSVFTLLGLLASPLFGDAEGHPRPTVVVIASVGVEAHRSAVEGIQEALAASTAEIRILDVDQASNAAGGGLVVARPAVIMLSARKRSG